MPHIILHDDLMYSSPASCPFVSLICLRSLISQMTIANGECPNPLSMLFCMESSNSRKAVIFLVPVRTSLLASSLARLSASICSCSFLTSSSIFSSPTIKCRLSFDRMIVSLMCSVLPSATFLKSSLYCLVLPKAVIM